MVCGDDFCVVFVLLEKRQDVIVEWEKCVGVLELECVVYDCDCVSFNFFNEIFEFFCQMVGDIVVKVEFVKCFMNEDFGGDQFLIVLELMCLVFGNNQFFYV